MPKDNSLLSLIRISKHIIIEGLLPSLLALLVHIGSPLCFPVCSQHTHISKALILGLGIEFANWIGIQGLGPSLGCGTFCLCALV